MSFRPAWWLPSPHLQTLWPVFFRRHELPELQRERLELADGDFLDLDWGLDTSRPTVLVLHGLEGSLSSHYVPGLLNQLHAFGYCPVFMHFRSCSGEPNRLPRSYHSGETEDMAAVVKHVGDLTGRPVYAAIGFSLGANALLKWLGETGEANPLQRAVAVSVPFSLDDAARRLRSGVSRLYESHLLRSLKRAYREKFQRMDSPLKVDVDALRGFREFDDQVTAPLNGFDGVDDYYARCSSRQYLRDIHVDTRIIHAEDDPFMMPTTAPSADELSDCVELLLTQQGGHIGFVSGASPWSVEFWHEHRILEFLGEADEDSSDTA